MCALKSGRPDPGKPSNLTGMLTIVMNFVGRWPLWLLHGCGTLLGWLVYGWDKRYRQQLAGHLQASGLVSAENYPAILRASIAHQGKNLLELPVAWVRSAASIAELVQACHGWEHAEAALAIGQPIIFVTPHLGSFDIAGRYVSTRLPFPLTALYRPPRLGVLEPLMNAGRVRDKGRVAPANASGVRVLLKALKAGQATVILPDQVPGGGDGVWAPFFGRPAYTMTLLARLARATDAAVLLFFAERLPWGRGFIVHLTPMSSRFCGQAQTDAALLNREIEQLIAKAPAQYLWSYNRYKQPAGALPAESPTC